MILRSFIVLAASTIFAVFTWFTGHGKASETPRNALVVEEQNGVGGFDQRAFSEELSQWRQRILSVGADAAYAEFQYTYKSARYGKQHIALHAFGEALYDTVGARGVATCDSYSSFGCYHGFFGRAFTAEGVGAISHFDAECKEKWGKDFLPCQHGLGHGLLVYLGDTKLVDALQLCRSITWQPIGGCSSGVFMEYNFHSMEHADTPRVRPLGDTGNEFAPCNTVPADFRQSCFFEQPQWWEAIFHDFSKIGKLCGAIEPIEYRETCFRGTGGLASSLVDFDVKETLARCEKMPSIKDQQQCREGASWTYFANERKRGEAEQLCLGQDTSAEERCIAMLHGELNSVSAQ